MQFNIRETRIITRYTNIFASNKTEALSYYLEGKALFDEELETFETNPRLLEIEEDE